MNDIENIDNTDDEQNIDDIVKNRRKEENSNNTNSLLLSIFLNRVSYSIKYHCMIKLTENVENTQLSECLVTHNDEIF